MSFKILLSSPHMGGYEENYVKFAFESNWIAPLGPNVDEFEKDLCQFVDTSYCAVLSSGTAAIHLALILLGIGAGDEVLCSTFTFSASANPIKYVGATPIFIDSEKSTWNMCPKQLELAISDRIALGRKPKAIILVHLYGMPANLDEILKISNHYEIPIIEDAAEALGSEYNGKKLGTFGELSVLSFNGNKLITTSGGGALLSKNEDYIKKAKFLATQARDVAPHYQHSHIGYNYRLSNVCAGIGRGQMKVVSERVAQRRFNNTYYKQHLNEDIKLFSEPSEAYFSNHWLTCIVLENYEHRELVRNGLAEKGIESRPLWKPMHLQPIFEDCPFFGNGTSEYLFERGLCLPSGSNLTTFELDEVINTINAYV